MANKRPKAGMEATETTSQDGSPGGTDSSTASPEKKVSIMGYFRNIFRKNPRLLDGRSNDHLLERWLKDNPGHTEVPRNVKFALANVKSTLRKSQRKNSIPSKDGASSPSPSPSKSLRNLESLEIMIDECFTFAHNLDREGLADVIRLLRRARNEVVWKMGQNT